jgi:hypothetical protein
MRINWKKTIIITLDFAIGIYLVFAFTKLNKPDESNLICTKVNINIQDEMTNGFLDAKEIKKRLKAKKIYPLEKPLNKISTRHIEETLMQEDESSSTSASTVMLPSKFFWPAIPVILDDPSSIATINSFGIVFIYYLILFYFY